MVTQQIVTMEVAEPDPVDHQGVFLRIIGPLDEERGYWLDFPGHRSGMRLETPMQALTRKHGIWNLDGRFDSAALVNGQVRMPEYELCLEADSASAGASRGLADCGDAETQTWMLQDSSEFALAASQQLCVTIEEGPGIDAGGPQYVRGALDSKHALHRPVTVSDGRRRRLNNSFIPAIPASACHSPKRPRR